MTSPLMQIADRRPRGDEALPANYFSFSAPFWSLGLRPFYLFASAYAVIALLLWLGGLFLGVSSPIRDPLWHAHEMVFGFGFPVVAGFLFTAVRNWTRQPTPSQKSLALIAALWFLARLGLWIHPLLAAVADVTFAWAVAWGIWGALRSPSGRKNLFFVAILVAMGGVNGLFYLVMQGWLPLSPARALTVALDLMLFIMALMGGRVIPSFTANKIRQPYTPLPWLERAALGGVLLLLLADAFAVPNLWGGMIAALAAGLHLLRLVRWRGFKTGGQPLLWVLHGAYGFICLHLLLKAMAAWGWVPMSVAVHALTVGGMGALVLGMMTRTARGHTGHAVEAGRAEVAMFCLVLLAAVVRVFLPLWSALSPYAWAISGCCWVAAFGLYFLRYWSILVKSPAQ